MTADFPHPTGTTAEAARLWGSDDLARAFTTDKRVVPWRSAPRRKGQPLVPEAEVARLLHGGPALADVDPRALHATQTWVVASHVAYYRTDRWETTGTTSADQHQYANRYPLIWVDPDGRHLILGGHHRAFAALLEARPVRARVLRDPAFDAVAVLPRLLAGTRASVPTISTTDPLEAADHIRSGATVLVPDVCAAEETLRALDIPGDLVAERLRNAASHNGSGDEVTNRYRQPAPTIRPQSNVREVVR